VNALENENCALTRENGDLEEQLGSLKKEFDDVWEQLQAERSC
jgi:hypothetical protein